MMITNSEIQDIIKDLFIQYGIPSDTNYKLYSSIIKSSLIENPDEEKLIQLSLDMKIPSQLYENRNNSQIIQKIIDDFSSDNQIDLQSSRWVVMIWADVMGISVEGSSGVQQYNIKSPICGNGIKHNVEYCKEINTQTTIFQSPEVYPSRNICEICGKALEENTKFCKYCGSNTMISPEPEVYPSRNLCQSCGKELEDNAKFCKYCGSHTTISPEPEVGPSRNTCQSCGKELVENTKFCKYCGSNSMISPEPEVYPSRNLCQNCGKGLEANAKFCNYCGFKKKIDQPQKKIEKEYRRTCNRCGTVWHSLVSRENSFKWFVLGEVISSAVSPSNVLTCGMCGEFAGRHKKDKIRNKQNEMDRLRACPKCNSHDYKEEIIEYEI